MTGRQAFERARNVVSPITEEELLRVVEIWADTALRLQERDLKVMDRLIRAQSRSAQQADKSHSSNVFSLHAVGGQT
jgi:DSF synthase